MVSVQNALNPQNIHWQNDESYVLLNPRLSPGELASLEEVATEISRRHDLKGHIWLATSGSTAESAVENKLVALSKQAFLASATAVNHHFQASASDTWLQVLPRFHVGGLGIEVRAALAQSQVISDFEKWNPERAVSLMQDRKVTIASMVPTQVFDVVQAKLSAPKYLRAVIVGGGALTETLYQRARKLGWPLLPSYGMTETCSQIATASLESLHSESMPLAKKLNHAEWRTTPEGLLQVKGSSLLTLYGQRQKDGSIRDWDPKTEGWFTSEDHVVLQDDFIRVLGRGSDFIKIGGEGSSLGRLREIFERALSQVDGSVGQQLLLIDAPSPRLGTEIHMVSTRRDLESQLKLLQEIFNREVLPFERIREVKYISSVPRSELGKVLWAQLKRDLYGR
jgi:O-succinylbenzoic acid--CoA ligase